MSQAKQPIRVVVVDDSALMRQILTSLIEQDTAIRVVGTASNGQEAIEVVSALHPDVVTMDVRMPVMDGLAATEQLMAYCPTPILVLTASLARYEVDITFKMIEAGALEVIEKPVASTAAAIEQASRDLVQRIKLLARVKVVTHLRGRRKHSITSGTLVQQAPPAVRPVAHHASAGFPVIVIGASTGGPRVIYQMLGMLPANLRAAVLVVQHIAAGFSSGMAEWLATGSRLPVRLAAAGAHVRAGEVLIAPDQHDLTLSSTGRIHLSTDQRGPQCPTIDVTMRSAADAFGPRVVGVLLTGMGHDGVAGLRAIQQVGGVTLAQDEASSTIFGMPRAARDAGVAAELLPPDALATRLINLVQEHNRQTVV